MKSRKKEESGSDVHRAEGGESWTREGLKQAEDGSLEHVLYHTGESSPAAHTRLPRRRPAGHGRGGSIVRTAKREWPWEPKGTQGVLRALDVRAQGV